MKFLKILTTSDIYTLSMLIFYTILALIFNFQLNNFYAILGLNIFLIALIIWVSSLSTKYQNNKKYELTRSLYLIPIVFIIYSQVQQYIPFVNSSTFDGLLASWDRALFGVNPTEWIYQFANPILTEYFQFSYMSYYFIPVILGVEFILYKPKEDFDYLIRNILFAFYLSYIAYLFMPAIGPRFTIHNFLNLGIELPGILLTDFFRWVVDSGGGIPPGVTNPQDFINKDCMPSGHTWISIVNMYIAFKFNSKFKYFILIFGSSLIVATIYLRYHYVVDVIVGAILSVIFLSIEPSVNKLITKFKSNLQEKPN